MYSDRQLNGNDPAVQITDAMAASLVKAPIFGLATTKFYDFESVQYHMMSKNVRLIAAEPFVDNTQHYDEDDMHNMFALDLSTMMSTDAVIYAVPHAFKILYDHLRPLGNNDQIRSRLANGINIDIPDTTDGPVLCITARESESESNAIIGYKLDGKRVVVQIARDNSRNDIIVATSY